LQLGNKSQLQPHLQLEKDELLFSVYFREFLFKLQPHLQLRQKEELGFSMDSGAFFSQLQLHCNWAT
jgi:hypothetical protein